jgi:hypothetical protein
MNDETLDLIGRIVCGGFWIVVLVLFVLIAWPALVVSALANPRGY